MISINGGSTTYTYDGGGSRLTKTTGGTTTRYFFGVAEKTNSSWTKILVGTPAGIIEWDNGAILFKSSDHLGSPRIITNASGALTGRTDLFPYGEVWSETGTSTKYKFSGKESDSESGNDYFGERYLGNTDGRFLTVDPVIHLSDPQSFNAYAYTRNDPINMVDPNGMDATWVQSLMSLATMTGNFILGYMAQASQWDPSAYQQLWRYALSMGMEIPYVDGVSGPPKDSPPSRDRSLSVFSRQSQFGTLDKAVSSDFASGGIQMVADL